MDVCTQHPQRCCICVPGPSSYMCNLHSFTCGHVPACQVPANVQTGVQMAFGTPHTCARHFHMGASPHVATCHTRGCHRASYAGQLAPRQPTAFP